jgi:single-stranded-DNA-specific exonuclease
VHAQIGEKSLAHSIKIDAYLSLAKLSLELIDEIRHLAPFGAGNPPLILASHNLRLINHTAIGQRKSHLRLLVSDEAGNHHNIFWWHGANHPLPDSKTPFDLAYTLQANTYRGKRQLQIQLVDFHSTVMVHPKAEDEYKSIKIIDLRYEARPIEVLKSIRASHDVQVWVEGDAKKMLGGLDRIELSPGNQLAVWSTPPGPDVWRSTLEQVKPKKLYLFAMDPQMDDPNIFFERLAGLVKFALRTKNGEIHLRKLAASTCHQEKTVRMGLLWLEAKGVIQITHRSETEVSLAKGSGVERFDAVEVGNELTLMLAETAAYRAYFKTASNNLT